MLVWLEVNHSEAEILRQQPLDSSAAAAPPTRQQGNGVSFLAQPRQQIGHDLAEWPALLICSGRIKNCVALNAQLVGSLGELLVVVFNAADSACEIYFHLV